MLIRKKKKRTLQQLLPPLDTPSGGFFLGFGEVFGEVFGRGGVQSYANVSREATFSPIQTESKHPHFGQGLCPPPPRFFTRYRLLIIPSALLRWGDQGKECHQTSRNTLKPIILLFT